MKNCLCFLMALLFSFSVALGEGVSAVEAPAEADPVKAEEITSLWDELMSLARSATPLNIPKEGAAEEEGAPEYISPEDSLSEDGYALEYSFGTVYASTPELTEESTVNGILLTLEGVPALRNILIDTEINDIMTRIPCGNPEMEGDDEGALLYLSGDVDSGFSYGRVFRYGQRISALQYGVVEPGAARHLSLTMHTSDNSVDCFRLEGVENAFDPGAAAALLAELEALSQEKWYSRVPFSYDGSVLTMFNESDLYFQSLSYPTAQPEQFGENVEAMLMDNGDGTWLLLIAGEGFEAVFTCDKKGRNAVISSFTFLDAEWEGPRGVRLGDYFQEDFNRFRHGDGELDMETMKETLYGTPGTAPWAEAEYDAAGDMILRYVTKTLGGPDVELFLRYEDTVLTEMILLTLEDAE